jgi:hypothetical protein
MTGCGNGRGWRRRAAVLALLLAAGLMQAGPAGAQIFNLGGTSGQSPAPASVPGSDVVPPDVLTIPQLPVPPNVTFVIDDTVIVGNDEDWTGQVILATPYSVVQMTQFFRAEMPRMGWTETAIVRARRTSISFVRDQRVATIRITQQRDDARRTEVDVVVSPSLAGFSAPAGR